MSRSSVTRKGFLEGYGKKSGWRARVEEGGVFGAVELSEGEVFGLLRGHGRGQTGEWLAV